MKVPRPRRRFDLILTAGVLALILILAWGSYWRAQQTALEHSLVAAARYGDYHSAKRLLDAGVTPNARLVDKSHGSATFLDHLKSLFSRGNTNQGQTALQWAIGSGNTNIAKLLLARGATGVNAPDPIAVYKSGYLLHAAVREGDADVVSALLDKGADIEVRDWIKDTPLHYAIAWKQPNILRLLLERGADPNAEEEQHRTVLQNALWGASTQVIETLIDHGADVNKKCQGGSRPLFWAIRFGRTSVIELLLRKGALVNVKGRKGTTPLAYAKQFKRTEVIVVLERAGATL